MIYRIVIYYLLIIGILIVEPRFKLLSKIGTDNDSYIFAFLIVLFLGVVLWELSARNANNQEPKTIRKGIFILSFWLGGIWGLMMTFAAGTPSKVDITLLVLLVINFSIAGGIFGLLGVGFSACVSSLMRQHY